MRTDLRARLRAPDRQRYAGGDPAGSGRAGRVPRQRRRGMTTHAIELIDLYAGYGRIEVLHGVNLAIPSGTVFALLGPNGGGKSTTLQVLSGAIRPTSGCVHVAGAHVNGASPDALAR